MITTSVPIRNLLMHPKLWRFLGFVSSLVGLLCFALSSSFEHVFGEWNLLKTYVYIGISFIVCGTMLSAYKWKLSKSLLLKAHVGFLALIITSLYSSFYHGKPDPVSLTSCAAFALASLSLSRQIDLGFEVDLFNFFPGLLLAQLMMIHKWLAFVGAPICYLLMLLRSHLDSQLHTGSVRVTEHVAVEIDFANRVEEGAEGGRQNEFYSTLGIDQVREERFLFPLDIEAKLKDAMASGFAGESCHIYISWRRQFFDKKLSKIQLHKLNIEKIDKVPLTILDNKIQRWIMASNYVLRTLLPDERNLCNRVFSGFPPYGDLCFVEACQRPVTQLLNFADVIAAGNGSPELWFRILSVFETMRDLLPDFDSLFSDQYSVVLRDRAITIWKRLGEVIKGAFVDLEDLIRQDPGNVVVPNGGLHPITHYVMNYLHMACASWRTIDRIFNDSENGNLSPSPLSLQMIRIMELLNSYLKTNAETYKDSALVSVFMMNNTRYIVHNANRSKLGLQLGEKWIREHTEKVQKYLVRYNRSSWGKVHEMLTLKNKSLTHDASPEWFKLLMLKFEGICEVQSKWVIFDKHLREKVRSSSKRILLAAYAKFVARFHDVETGMEEVIVAGINKLFMGRDELINLRHIQPTWTVVTPTTGDFYEWTMYGEEIVLNSARHRYSYWCIHKFNQGCQATKQVQQRQDNPQMYEIRYIGFHTCRIIPKAPQILTIAHHPESSTQI